MNRLRLRRLSVCQRRAWAISEALDRWFSRFSDDELARVLAYRQQPAERREDGATLKVAR